MARYAGIDLGATNVRAVVGGTDGTILGRSRRATPDGPSGDAITDAVLDTLDAAGAEAGVAVDRLEAVGIGSIGPLDPADGAVARSVNVSDGIDRIPLVDPVEARTGAGVTLHNDAVAAVIGERFYREDPPPNVVYLTLSTGIGAGVCVDGHVLRGRDGNAAEVGHLLVDPEGRLTCGCGIPGHWEAYCAGSNIPRYARALDNDSIDTELSVHDPDFDAAEVFATPDDPLAGRVIDRVTRWNRIGVADLVHAYAPELLSVGGAIALNNPGLVVDPLRGGLGDVVMTSAPEIELTPFGDEVVVRGALASVLPRGSDG